MLDREHPDYRWTLEAAALIDTLRKELEALRRAGGSAEIIGRSEQITLDIVPRLRALASNHFSDRQSIQDDLLELVSAVGKLDHTRASSLVQQLEGGPSRPGFGVWAL